MSKSEYRTTNVFLVLALSLTGIGCLIISRMTAEPLDTEPPKLEAIKIEMINPDPLYDRLDRIDEALRVLVAESHSKDRPKVKAVGSNAFPDRRK